MATSFPNKSCIMKYEINRLLSFQGKWFIMDIKEQDLAATGLFYLKVPDNTQCAFCHVVLTNWKRGMNPESKHRQKSPMCPFLNNIFVGNVPFSNPVKALAPKCLYVNSDATYPHNSEMTMPSERSETYNRWSLIGKHEAKTLINCGFYYTGVADVCACYSCGSLFGNWDYKDDPWTLHSTFSPRCLFVESKMMASRNPDMSDTSDEEEYISNQEETSDEDLTDTDESIIVLEKEVIIIKQPDVPQDKITSDESMVCKICLENEKRILFQPCKHLVTCVTCSRKLVNCPMCRQVIARKEEIFMC